MPLSISYDWKVLTPFGLNLVVYDSKNVSMTFVEKIQNFDIQSQACILVERLILLGVSSIESTEKSKNQMDNSQLSIFH